MTPNSLKSKLFFRKYGMDSELIDVLIQGRSIIDLSVGLSEFGLRTDYEVISFLRSYGFELDDPIEGAEIQGNFQEALQFIRKYFLFPENPNGIKLEVPRKIIELQSPKDLVLMSNLSFPGQAADVQGTLLKNWACSILKVMHTISHMDRDLRTSYFSEVQKQIFDRLYKALVRDDEGKLFLGDHRSDPMSVPLVSFETKPKKPRDSVLLKLLHKPENVAEDIFDRIGVRFVTKTKVDALRVVKYLIDSMLVMPANAKPSRARNNLVDLGQWRALVREWGPGLERGEMEESDFLSLLEKGINPSDSDSSNPHSSKFYRSIQFTCRQLIKIKNPAYEEIRDLKNSARQGALPKEVQGMVDRVDMRFIQKEVRFFYPFEVQILDQQAFEENEKGRSAHQHYKESQVQTAMKRVLRSFIDGGRK